MTYLLDELELYAVSGLTWAKRVLCIVSDHAWVLVRPIDRKTSAFYRCKRCERTRPVGFVEGDFE